ncbi:MAG: hypothetical protein M1822_009576 [Bathelium mastoideum]|nr:MAG: hypothetical protein M1822_009576 [Bathelium mastoideum]
MKTVLIYLITIGSSGAVVAMWRLSRTLGGLTGRLLIPFLFKQLVYTLVVKRQNGTSNVSRLSALSTLIYIIGNTVASFIGITDQAQLAERLTSLFSINLVPLYLGGRTSFIMDRILGIPLTQVGLSHRWIGRVCAAQGITHALLKMNIHRPRISTVGTLLLAVFSSLTFTSILYLRRRLYELFLKSHFLLAICFLCVLWIHIGNARRLHFICLVTASAIWAVQHVLWLAYLLYRNCGYGSATVKAVTTYPKDGPIQTIQLQVTPKRLWRVRPGEYIYLGIPSTSKYGLGYFQMHPYFVAWTSEPYQKSRELTVLVQSRGGFSSDLRNCELGVRAIIDGPYRSHSSLRGYDTVLFLASGMGIAAHLLEIRSLLQAHDEKAARVRRITLHCVKAILNQLLEMNRAGILNIMVYVPKSAAADDITVDVAKNAAIESVGELHLFRLPCTLELDWLINQEYTAEAGNLAISTPTIPSPSKKNELSMDGLPTPIRLGEPLLSPFTPRRAVTTPDRVPSPPQPRSNVSKAYSQRRRKRYNPSRASRKRSSYMIDTNSDSVLPDLDERLTKNGFLGRDGRVGSASGGCSNILRKLSFPHYQVHDRTRDEGVPVLDGGEWPITKILKSRQTSDGIKQYLVRWEDTWLEEYMISREAIIDFKETEAMVQREVQRRMHEITGVYSVPSDTESMFITPAGSGSGVETPEAANYALYSTLAAHAS